MSISSEINRIGGNVSSAFGAVRNMGGTVPSGATSDNLAAAIRSIPQEGGEGGSERFIIGADCTADDFWSGSAEITLDTGAFAATLDALYAGQDVVLQLAVVEEVPGEDPIISDGFAVPLTYFTGSETEIAGTTTVRPGGRLFTVSVNLFDDDTVVVVNTATDKLVLTGEVRELEDGDEAELAGLPYASLVQSISSLRTQLGAFGIYALDNANIDYSMLQDAFYAGVPVYFGVEFSGMVLSAPMSVLAVDENTIAMTGTISTSYISFNLDIAVVNDNDETHIVMIMYTRQGGIV